MTVRIAKQPINLRERLSELERPIGLKGSELMRAETTEEAFNVLGCGRKNFIINGAFEIWQRGTSFSNINNGDYAADRFLHQKTGQTDITRVNVTDENVLKHGFRYAVRQTAVAASIIKPLHIIEKHPLFVGGNNFVFSFWARSNSPISYTFSMYDGSSSFNGLNLDIGTEWKRYVIPLTLEQTPATYLRLHLSRSRDAGDWLETTGWQFESGTTVTPFEHRSYGEELALCQRYYVSMGANSTGELSIGVGYCESNLVARGYVQFPTTMRDNPNVTSDQLEIRTVSGLTRNVNSVTFSSNLNGVYIDGSNTGFTAGAGGIIQLESTAGKLEASAEL